VRTSNITSGTGFAVGGIKDGKKRLEDVDFLRLAFDSFDVDKSGYLDPQELRAALTMLGVRRPGAKSAMDDMGLDDADGDGVISLGDLDQNGDEKVDFEEFKIFAAILPKRDHPIYRNALAAKPVTLPRDLTRATPVMIEQHKAQEACQEALKSALRHLKHKLKLNDKKVTKDTVLLRKFQELDTTGDARVDIKELINFLNDSSDGELSKSEAWLLMNCADTNNDKHMTFDEFKKMMQTVGAATDE